MSISGKFFNLDTDNTLGGNNASDKKASSQKAVKEYVDNAISSVSGGGEWVYTSHTQILNSTTLGNHNINLSSILPSSSNSKYELLLSIEADTNGVSNVFPISFPVDFRNLNYLQERKFEIYGESAKTNKIYEFSTNAINYIYKFGGICVPISGRTLYSQLAGTDSMTFNSFKVFLDAYKIIG